MRLIAHLSDLHFGAEDPAVVEQVLQALDETAPHLVVVSGDLTQRARGHQFRAANQFLRRMEASGRPVLVVPGNHDVPLYDVARRFLSPLGRYCRIIGAGRADWYEDEEVAVLGLFSPRSLTIKHGRLNEEQIARIGQRFSLLPRQIIRLLVTHHPLVPLPGVDGRGEHAPLKNAEAALAAARRAHVHLVLAGHHHATHVEPEPAHRSTDRGVLVVQAGTATSVRRRNEANSFNLIRIERGRLDISVMNNDGGRPFHPATLHRFSLDEAGWHRLESES